MNLKPASYINLLRPLKVGAVVPQADGVGWLMKALQRIALDSSHSHASLTQSESISRALNLYERLLTGGSIDARHTFLSDYTHQNWETMELFRIDPLKKNSLWYEPSLQNRMRLFGEYSAQLIAEAYRDLDQAPSYGIQVSCTGYDAPTAMQKLVTQRGWNAQTQLLHLGHMGCYAVMPACHLAHQLLLSNNRIASDQISLFLVELCTLHLHPAATDADQIVMNTLFADGAIRIDMGRSYQDGALAHLGYCETIIPDSLDKMTWRVADSAFQMTLNRRVPHVIKSDLPTVLKSFLHSHGLTIGDIQRFAIHPGGPRIIESVAEALKLDESAYSHSSLVLRNYGNMSSCTVPHVWHAIAQDPKVQEGELIVSLAFGPGLTMTANLLRKGR